MVKPSRPLPDAISDRAKVGRFGAAADGNTGVGVGIDGVVIEGVGIDGVVIDGVGIDGVGIDGVEEVGSAVAETGGDCIDRVAGAVEVIGVLELF